MSWGPQTNPNGTALTGRKPTLPPLGDLVTDLLNGMTTDEMAQMYNCSAGRIKAVLNQGGYSSTTGQPLQPAVAELAYLAAAVVPGPWVADALCAQVDSAIFFPEKGGSTTEAKAVCARCPVREECLDYALANNERFGIWGGSSERDRRRLTGHTSVKTCPQCGEKFTVSTGSNSVTYCGGQCRRAARARIKHDSYSRTRSTA